MLSRDQILAADDLPREELDVPEWGGSVFIRTMTGAERDRFEAAYTALKQVNIRARLAAVTICDEAGKPLFADADITALGAKSAAALDRVFEASMRLNRVGIKDVEELEKNSSAGPSEDSASDSP